MSGPDLDDVLRELAAHGERDAVAADPARVRRLGERRRHRRYALTAAVASAVVATAAGAVLTQAPGLTHQTPPPVASGGTAVPAPPPTPTPAPRTLGPVNLLAIGDVPTGGGPTLEIAPTGRGRSVDEISVCVPDGLAVLGASGSTGRNFAYPGQQEPAVYTVALQFPSAEAAEGAERTVQGWVDDCAAELGEDGATVLGTDEPEWVQVETPPGSDGRFALVPLYRAAGQNPDEGVFESLGLTRVDDRLMLTVRVVAGMDDNVSLDPEPDPADGMPPHPQFALVTAGAERLAR